MQQDDCADLLKKLTSGLNSFWLPLSSLACSAVSAWLHRCFLRLIRCNES